MWHIKKTCHSIYFWSVWIKFYHHSPHRECRALPPDTARYSYQNQKAISMGLQKPWQSIQVQWDYSPTWQQSPGWGTDPDSFSGSETDPAMGWYDKRLFQNQLLAGPPTLTWDTMQQLSFEFDNLPALSQDLVVTILSLPTAKAMQINLLPKWNLHRVSSLWPFLLNIPVCNYWLCLCAI